MNALYMEIPQKRALKSARPDVPSRCRRCRQAAGPARHMPAPQLLMGVASRALVAAASASGAPDQAVRKNQGLICPVLAARSPRGLRPIAPAMRWTLHERCC